MTTPNLAIRIISLTDSHARRQAVAENLEGSVWAWAFLDALRPDDPSPATPDPQGQRRLFGRRLTGGEEAVFKSHLHALAAFDDDPALDWLLVMEDDVWIDPDFPYDDLAAFLEDRGIGYLRLFGREWKRALPRFRFGERQVLYLTSDPYGTQGYLIARGAAARLRDRLTHIRRPIDDEFGRFWENGLDNHMLFPFPMVERNMPSTLNADRDAAKTGTRGGLGRLWVRLTDLVAKRRYMARRRAPWARDRIRARKR